MVKIIYDIVRAFVCLHKHLVLCLIHCGSCPVNVSNVLVTIMKLTYFSQIYVIKVHPRTGHDGPDGE